jgi:HK97 family phage prohead protease
VTVTHLPSDVAVVRALTDTPAFRDAAPADDTLGVLAIRFSVFNTWYEVDSFWEGRFLERTAPGAFAQTIAEDRDRMRVLFDHGFDPTIGNKVLGPIDDLREDPDSPVGEVPLLDTTYNRDLLPGLKRNLYGSSFRMRVMEESWVDEPAPSDYNPKALPERTITRTKTYEFGPVTFPANPDASAGMRSLTDTYYDRLKQRDTSAFEAAVRAAGRPDLTGRPGAWSAGVGDPDVKPSSGEPSSPSDEMRQRDRVLAWNSRSPRVR